MRRPGSWRITYGMPIVFTYVYSIVLLYTCLAFAEPTDASKRAICATECSKESCLPGDTTANGLKQCREMCDKRCIAEITHHAILYPKYRLLTIMYAPPGCTSTSSARCGTVSSVDYQSGSSTGTKTSIQESFKSGTQTTVGETQSINYKGTNIGKFSGAFGEEFVTTSTDGVTETTTKSQNVDFKVQANGDGIDHKQDQFFILLNPAIYLSVFEDKVAWETGYAGNAAQLYVLYGAWLEAPSSMPKNVGDELNRRGFTISDYQTLLAQDPLIANPNVVDSKRYAPTKLTFPYEPPLTQANCNGGVCNCVSLSRTIRNEYQKSVVNSYQTQYTTSLTGSVDLLSIFNWKDERTSTETITQSGENLIGTSNSATASISCPSATYAGPTLMAVYWDTLVGSFMFFPVQPDSGIALLQKGHVTDLSGRPAVGQEVVLGFGGTTLRTFTDRSGNFRFYDLSKAASKYLRQSATVSVGSKQRQVTIGAAAPSFVKLR